MLPLITHLKVTEVVKSCVSENLSNLKYTSKIESGVVSSLFLSSCYPHWAKSGAQQRPASRVLERRHGLSENQILNSDSEGNESEREAYDISLRQFQTWDMVDPDVDIVNLREDVRLSLEQPRICTILRF